MKKLVGGIGVAVLIAAWVWAIVEGIRIELDEAAHAELEDDAEEEWHFVVKDFPQVTPEEHEALMNAVAEVRKKPGEVLPKLSLIYDDGSHG